MKRRIFFVLILLNVLASIAYAIFSINSFNQQYREEATAKIKETCEDISITGLVGDYRSVAESLANGKNRNIAFVDKNGAVLAQSGILGSAVTTYAGRKEFVQALNEGYGFDAQKVAALNSEFFFGAMPIRNSDIIVCVAMPVKSVLKNVLELWSGLIIVLLLLMLSSTMISWRFTSRFTDPIARMTEAADAIAGGQYGRRISIQSGDELEHLANSFNKMSERLSTTVGSLEEQVGKLDAIVGAMPNGVIAVDNSLRVIMHNPVAEELLEFDCYGNRIRDLVSFPLLAEVLNTAKESGGVLEKEGNKGDKILRVYAAPVLREGKRAGAVALIADVTDLRRLENLRTEFAANVSHELKTPLTSIRGFTETLLAGAINDPVSAKKFLGIIEIESDRLMQLINDILIISEIEHGTLRSAEPVDVDSLMNYTCAALMPQANAKHISLSVEKQCGKLIYGNPLWYNQMLSNMVGNAIKYTPEGGSVSIGAEVVDENMEIYVVDTGIGIDKEHLPRLFERFYRVDKGRTRVMGGTGLGLAIVKHTAQSAGGSVSVESEPGVGSRFSVLLPIYRSTEAIE